MNYFVSGIDTDSGKTLASAIFCEAFGADYWKPIQAGLPKDSETVKSLVTNTQTKIHAEAYLLNTPASPHAAAKKDGITISLDKIKIPPGQNNLIIEGAGGCLVPLNDEHFVIDMIHHLGLPTILVADLYLGSINHTLLSLEALRKRKIPVKGIIFNGEANSESERIILLRGQTECLLRISKEIKIDKAIVKKYAKQLIENWNGQSD